MRRSRNIYYIPLLLVVIVIGLLHATTPGDRVFVHETLRRLSYFPIIVGGLLYGIRGGLILATCSCLAFIPHLHLFHSMNYQFYLGELTEVILYYLAGIVVGGIASREFRLRRRYQDLSVKLEKSYRRLHEQTRLLLKVEEQLRTSQKLSALGRLAASLAHEIKNPLASIRGTAEILMDDFPEGHPKREFITIMMAEISRLNTSVQDILQYSRGEQAPGRTVPEPTVAIIRRVCSLVEGQIRGKSIRLDLTFGPGSDTGMADGPKLSQVILNVLLNAVEATPEKGHITIDHGLAGDGQQVRICDSGPGIRPQDAETIFKPFVTFKHNGTGLGLHISRTLMTTLGGTITANPTPSGGACFTLVLPETPKPS